MDEFFKTLPKKHTTKKTGVYYKEIQKTTIDKKGNSKVTTPDKMYYIRYKDENKKDIWITIGKFSEGIREAYCERKRIEALNLIKLGEQPDIVKKKHKKEITTLDNIFKKYYEHKKTESKDIKRTEQRYSRNIKDNLGHRDIENITTDDILELKKKLISMGRAEATINSLITFVGTLFNFAIDEGIYTKLNPVKSKKLKSMKVDNTRDRYLTTEEIHKLYDAVQDDEDIYTFVKLSLSTGGRLETILNIQKKDINLSNHTITLKDLKSNSTYTGFLDDDTIALLENKLSKLSVNGYVVGEELTKYATRTLQRKLQKIINDLFNDGLDKSDTKNRAVIHTLRHTFASHLAINGTPIFTIQKLMNHSDIKMTMRYAKLAPDSGMDAVKNLYR